MNGLITVLEADLRGRVRGGILFDPSAAATMSWQRHKSHERESDHCADNTNTERRITASATSHHSTESERQLLSSVSCELVIVERWNDHENWLFSSLPQQVCHFSSVIQ